MKSANFLFPIIVAVSSSAFADLQCGELLYKDGSHGGAGIPTEISIVLEGSEPVGVRSSVARYNGDVVSTDKLVPASDDHFRTQDRFEGDSKFLFDASTGELTFVSAFSSATNLSMSARCR